MSTYTTNTKPESKFEDVPEEVLTDPTMRTALGMDPIPGMNTPVDDNKQISMFDYMQNKNNSSASSSTTTTAAPEVTVFKNLVHPEFGELRTVEIDGEPWFVGKDVAAALGYIKERNALDKHVDKDDALKRGVTDSMGRTQQMTIINESGLYSLILSSKLPSAKEFKHWVTSEVLPSIRKHGAYMTQDTIQKALTNPDFLIQLATELKVEQQRRIEAEETSRLQQEQLKIAAPKVQYVDEVLQSVNTYNVNLIAKELGMSAETLNKKMHDMKVIYRNGQTWVLTAKYQGKGYTKTRTHSFTRSDGTIGTSMLTVWTESGRKFIHSLFKS